MPLAGHWAYYGAVTLIIMMPILITINVPDSPVFALDNNRRTKKCVMLISSETTARLPVAKPLSLIHLVGSDG